MSAVRAYDFDDMHESRVSGLGAQRVRVIKPRRLENTISKRFTKFARIAILVGLFLGAILFARLGLQAATIGVMSQSDEVEAQIGQVRTDSVNLEVEKSTASNHTNLKKAAKKLGMTNPTYTETLELEDDIVAYDEEGELSLSDSLAVASEG